MIVQERFEEKANSSKELVIVLTSSTGRNDRLLIMSPCWTEPKGKLRPNEFSSMQMPRCHETAHSLLLVVNA